MRSNQYSYVYERGVSLIEVIIGVSILATVLWGTVAAFANLLERGFEQEARIKAALLFEEAFEGMRFVRDDSWVAFEVLPIDTPITLSVDATGFTAAAATSSEVIDVRFERSIVLREVYRRDSDDVIVPSTDASAKTLDPDTRLIEIEVSWDSGAGTVLGDTYLTNLFE